MRIFTFLLLLSTNLIYGQSDFNSLLENVQSLKIPYSSQHNNDIQSQKKILSQEDNVFLVTQLTYTQPVIVNNFVSSPFGQLDCEDVKQCLDLENLKEVAIIGTIKVDSNNYLLHITLKPNRQSATSKGILVSMNTLGELNDWFFADLSLGNSNGSVSRDFKIDRDFKVTISEASWGKNNINYSLEAVYKVFHNKSRKNMEVENYNYDNNLENKMEYFDLKEGAFELKMLCLDI